MKYLKLILFVTLLILFNVLPIYALPIALSLLNPSNEFSSGNTVQFFINLNQDPVRPLSPADIYLNNAKIIKVSSIIVNLSKNSYFVYFDIPKLDDGKYNINVRLSYNIDNVLQELVSVLPINIVNNDKRMYLKPGIIKINIDETSYYQVALHNSGFNQTEANLSVSSINLRLSRNSIPLPQSFNKYFYVYFNKTNIKQLNQPLIIDYVFISYLDKKFMIPVYITNKVPEVTPIEGEKSKAPIKNISAEEKIVGLDFLTNTKKLDEIIAVNEIREGSLSIKNFLDRPLNNVRFELTGNLKNIVRLNVTSLPSLKPNETFKQYIWINEHKNATEGGYNGELRLLTQEGYNTTFLMKFNVFSKKEEKEEKVERKSDELIQKDVPLEEKYGFGSKPQEAVNTEGKINSKLIITLIFLFFVLLFILFYRFKSKKPKNTYIGDIKR